MSGSTSWYPVYALQKLHHETSEVESLSTSESLWSYRMSIDFIAGCIGGCAGVLVGHPLDTIKVHLQTQDPRNPVYRGTWHCMKTIVAQDKIRGLYRGITSPMGGIGMVNAIVFGIYGNVQRHTDDPDSLYSHMLAGSVAGFMQSIVCAPMELAKTRLQLQHNDSKGIKHKGPLDCLKHILHTEGVRGIFKGLSITAARDIPGFASYFVSYEYMMRNAPTASAFFSLMAGGFAGICSWLACYPLDVIKTCLQADGMSSSPKYTGVMDCMRKSYKSDGIHFFFRGLNSTLIRAFPMNAACFFVVSLIMRMADTTNLDLLMHSPDSLVVGVRSATLCHIHQHTRFIDDEVRRKRSFMAKSLRALGAFNEAVCYADADELASEFYPDSQQYYLLDEQRLDLVNAKSAD